MSGTNNLREYVDYFRQLAVKHKNLRHNPDSEKKDAPIGEKHFTKWNINELVGSLRTKLSYPALLLEVYEIHTDATIVHDIKMRPKGAFVIVQHVKEGDIIAEEAAYALTEKILNDFLKQIWQDHYGPDVIRCKTPFFKFDFDGLDIMTTGKILNNVYGWRVEFSFEFQHKIKFNVAPLPGTFDTIGVEVLGDDAGYLGIDDVQYALLKV